MWKANVIFLNIEEGLHSKKQKQNGKRKRAFLEQFEREMQMTDKHKACSFSLIIKDIRDGFRLSKNVP